MRNFHIRPHTHVADDTTIEWIDAQIPCYYRSLKERQVRNIFENIAVCMLMMMCVSLLNYAPVLLHRLFDQMPIVKVLTPIITQWRTQS